MTQGVTRETIDGFSEKRIQAIIEKIKFERYYPTPVRRTYRLKKSGKKRPLGVPVFRDKLVQEVVRQILEAIYEPLFSENSHGFRPGRSCQTALDRMKKCRGTSWVIEGDITGFFDNIDHEILMDILKRKIDDGRFLELVRRFLKAGYIEHEIRRDSVTGTPQGGLCKALHNPPCTKSLRSGFFFTQ
jgi:group II intron reverse transcriptase/maturase